MRIATILVFCNTGFMVSDEKSGQRTLEKGLWVVSFMSIWVALEDLCEIMGHKARIISEKFPPKDLYFPYPVFLSAIFTQGGV